MPDEQKKRRALAAMFAAAVLFSLMGVAAKATTRGAAPLSGGEVALFRYLFGLVFLLLLRGAAGVDLLGGDRRGLLRRGVLSGLAGLCFFVAIERTALTHAVLLNATSILWAPIFAAYSLGERLPRRGLPALLAALVGVLLVTRPRLGHVNAGDLIALLSGVLGGAGVTQIRRLRQRESAYAVFFYFNLIGLPLALLSLPVTGERFTAPAPWQWAGLLLAGAASIAAQLLMTYGYREIATAQGTLITLCSVAFTAVWAHALFGEALPPATLAGGALILFGAIRLALVPAADRPAPGAPP